MTVSQYSFLLQMLSQDIYSEDNHFIFELLQNAEDNDYTTETPTIAFKLLAPLVCNNNTEKTRTNDC